MSNNDKVPADKPATTPAYQSVKLAWVRISHHSPDHVAARWPYAGYGSNLSLEQMVRRCPTADIQGGGILRNAKLVFAYYLGIEEMEGASTPVGVFRLTAADVAALDRCEGLGRSYERYLVTVELNGEAVRCFTYVKRDNRLEEPSERYYQTCLRGYGDWNFDARRLRHAREQARKRGKRRTYSSGYGHWRGDSTEIDWNKYRGGGYSRGTTSNPRDALIPPVPSMDEEPEGNGTAASYQPRISLVTGRDLSRKARDAADTFKRKHGSGVYDDPTRTSTLNGHGQETFTGRDGQKWRKGPNGIWYRAKEE